ncbi:precorrin-6A/cobalt-precorrin-6A reductase [Primorskyibacter aestuariivivens]|uniref:precorrin-6A/cobalt-precorrin-6A reductase n=1 Tax=Primorskyibacter aestuariivivens TaxID=1888912 RepID=UPI0022FFCD22|nr:precorrin-6A/cobalt-precorrin-6A reductase [Primorskyibacter aestuariivivens]MDA7430737.1 precorrin-6A/cobalt-precorrin-6A reductase [Primorskyibacter aestuariivivens]
MFFVPRQKVLIIGGSAEARALAARLKGNAAVMLPAPERLAQNWPVPVVPALLSQEALMARLGYGVRVLVDASHPCDRESSQIAYEVARARDIPLFRIERAAWRPTRQDHWSFPRDEAAAARLVAPGERVLLATGRQSLSRLKGLSRAYVYARQISDHDDRFPLPRGRFLKGSAPFTVAQEVALMRRLRIDWIILRNAGGTGGWPKLEAARKLGVQVAMLPRPALPPARVVGDVSSALKQVVECL